MNTTAKLENDQQTLWNGPAAHGWVDAQETIDRVLKPFEAMLVQAVSAGQGHRVLDVGCGTGGTTVAVAKRFGSGGHCTGIDISEPMIAAARTRAERANVAASFICANAQSHAFEPQSFDRVISRFGVMFFDDPVEAFTNLRRATSDNGELQCIAWRSAGENPFMTTAERAAAPLLPDLPARRSDGPGQFAFADRSQVQSILGQSGWLNIDIQPVDVVCTLPENELLRYLTRIGPVGRALQDVDDQTRTRVIETVRAAFDQYVEGNEVRFTAACWTIRAQA